jgi:hypothetical protein
MNLSSKTKKAYDMFMANIGHKEIPVIQNPTLDDYDIIYDYLKTNHPYIPFDSVKVRKTFDNLGNQYIWPGYDAVHWEVEPIISKRYGVKTDQNNIEELMKGMAVPVTLATGLLASPQQAQAENWRGYQNKEPALQEPIIDPTTLLAGPARWGGGLMNLVANTGLNAIMGKLR